MKVLPPILLAAVLVGCSACTGGDSPPDTSRAGSVVGASTPGLRPVACTAEIVNAFFENKRFTGPGDTYDVEDTIVAVAELLDPTCARRSRECVSAVIETANRTPPGASRKRAEATYLATPACVG